MTPTAGSRRALLFRIPVTLAAALTLTAAATAPDPGSATPAVNSASATPETFPVRHPSSDLGPQPAGGPEAGDYVDPTTGRSSVTSVLRAFDKPAQNWLPGHRGVDLQLPVGARVLAAGDGTVAFTGMVAGTPVISIAHPDGIRTTYQPVFAHLSEGEEVVAGAVIGSLANPVDQWPGLHWGARVGEEYLNPLSLLSAPVIRLKPTETSGRPHRREGGAVAGGGVWAFPVQARGCACR